MSETAKRPLPLVYAALIAGLQSISLIGMSLEVFFDISEQNVKVSSGVGLMLLILGLGLGAAALGVAKSVHVARGPVFVAQLISLGLSWNMVKNVEELPGVTAVGVVLGLAALSVIAALATPSAREALADRPVI